MQKNRKGIGGAIQGFVGIMVLVIIAVAVIIPTTQQSINSGGFNGTLLVILQNIPVFIAIALLLGVVSLFYFKAR